VRWAEGIGPLGEPVATFYGILGDGHTAALGMAASSGLPLVPTEQRNPRIGDLRRGRADPRRAGPAMPPFIIGISGSTNER